MRTLFTILVVLALAGMAYAANEGCYGWEDGGTSLSDYGVVEYYNDSAHVSSGSAALAIRETGSGTGQIYVAWICGLLEGDEVTVSFDVYDDTPGSVYTSTRIWGHYALPGDVNSYEGSAGGNSTYSDGLGWNTLSQTWTIPAGKSCLMVEARPYGASPYDQTPNWIDNICVSAPARTTISFPGGTVAAPDQSWSNVKAMYR